MSKHYETGNSKNIANLQKLIEQITVYTAYNPSIENLNTLYTNTLNVLIQVEEKRNANKNAIHTRQQKYLNLKSITTRIINQLEILNLTEGNLAQVKSLNKAIQGGRRKKKEVANAITEEKKTISTSHQSFTQLATNFSNLLQILATIPTYNPNLEELKLANLNNYSTALSNSTKNVDHTEAEFNAKLIERDHILYNNQTGLYTIAQHVKKYVKSIYGSNSSEYANISKIKFRIS